MKESEIRQMIAHLYAVPGWSPLEIAEELGLTFKRVCREIDERCLRHVDFPIARKVRKATRADKVEPLDFGFVNPFKRP